MAPRQARVNLTIDVVVYCDMDIGEALGMVRDHLRITSDNADAVQVIAQDTPVVTAD